LRGSEDGEGSVMGLKVKGGMWCDSCQRPVAGQKSTAKIAKLSATVASGGTYTGTPSAYHCPHCGYTVRLGAQRQANMRVGLVVVIAIVLLALVVAGVGALVNGVRDATSGPVVVPDVTRMPLDAAKRALDSEHVDFAYDKDQGVFGIVDEKNWVVCRQDPPAGSRTEGSVWLDVRHWDC